MFSLILYDKYNMYTVHQKSPSLKQLNLLGSYTASQSSPKVERENGAMATLNVGALTLSTCFISKSPSCTRKGWQGKLVNSQSLMLWNINTVLRTRSRIWSTWGTVKSTASVWTEQSNDSSAQRVTFKSRNQNHPNLPFCHWGWSVGMQRNTQTLS